MNASERATEAGTRLFAQSCRFVVGVASLDALPAGDRPEFCFAGRSNVGKSSLLNALLGRRALAHASSVPGRTRQLNFFDLAATVWLVDLPGYGYARTHRAEARDWQRLTGAYLAGRRSLSRAYLLVDSRRGVGEKDHEMMTRLDAAGVSHRCILTKVDKLRAPERNEPHPAVRAALGRHPAAHPEPILTSARDRTGLDEIRADIAVLAGLAPPFTLRERSDSR